MSKTPIAFKDIKPGDKVECKWDDEDTFTVRAVVAVKDDNAVESPGGALIGVACDHYLLLDRPKPPVDLPTEPTLGWVVWTDINPGDTITFGTWRIGSDGFLETTDGEWAAPSRLVTAFTPATAVPTEALDEFRRVFENAENAMLDQINAGDRFLRAIDEANS